jgi:hypothetical protein
MPNGIVWEFGDRTPLAARMLDVPSDVLTNALFLDTYPISVDYGALATGFTLFARLWYRDPGSRFPYGYRVEPDR